MNAAVRCLAGAAAALVLAACGASSAHESAAEILWDDRGVPHVRAASDAELLRAFGWAQAESHGDQLLRSLGQARGRAAELWGAAFLESDRAVWTEGIPERAEAWYAAQQPEFRELLDAFAGGINDFALLHPRSIDDVWARALPVDGVDLLAHAQRVLHFGLVASAAGEAQALLQRGSNAVAIAPGRSRSGDALLLANPHLPWGEPWTLYEAQLESPGYRAYGAALVGFPVLGIAFQDELGWTHTLNPHDGADHFELELVDGGYRWAGGVRPFDVRRHVLRVRGPEGGLDEVEHVVRSSVHGPVVAQDGDRAVALRVVGLDRPHALRQWWEMGRAHDLAGFERALALEQLPTFTVVYADRAGHVLHQFGGLTPVRAEPQRDWGGLVPGDREDLLWREMLPLRELPRVLDPESGWVHSANDPPWSATIPCPLDASSFPPYVAPRFLHLAAQRSLKHLVAADAFALEDLERHALDTGVELAERLVPDLVQAARASPSSGVREAGDVLAAWDRRLDAASRGAVLFVTFVQLHQAGGPLFAEPWDPGRPLETPRGLASPARALADLARAAQAVSARFGSADAPWGEAYRLRRGGVDLPCSGGMRSLGVLRAFEFTSDPDGLARAVSGETFVAAVQFSTPLRARVLHSCGNSSRPGDPLAEEALAAAAAGRLSDALLTRDAIEAHLRRRERVPSPRPLP